MLPFPPFVNGVGSGDVLAVGEARTNVVSRNGIDWTVNVGAPLFPNADIQAVERYAGRWYGMPYDSALGGAASIDGMTWPIPVTFPLDTYGNHSLKRSGAGWLLARNVSAPSYYFSEDLITYSAARLSTGLASNSPILNMISDGDDGWVALNQWSGAPFGAMVATTPDGLNWTGSTLGPNPSGYLFHAQSLHYFGGVFLIGGLKPDGLGNTLETIYTLDNTLTVWTPAYVGTHEGATFYAFANNGSVVVAVGGGSGGPCIARLSGGWSDVACPGVGSLRDVTWSRRLQLFIAVGTGGKIVTSPTGEVWTERTSGTGSELRSVKAA